MRNNWGPGDYWAALLLLTFLIVALWIIVYTAARAAVGHMLDRVEPRLIVEARTTPEAVAFVLTNVGIGPAFDLAVRWSDGPAAEKVAYTQLLAPGGKLEWTITARPVVDEVMWVRKLLTNWAIDADPSALRKSATLAVLVPSRLDPPS